MRVVLRVICGGIALLVISGSYFVWHNNRSVAPPTHRQLGVTLENGIQWLTSHRQNILRISNPMLWRMVQRAGTITNDPRLKMLFTDYAKRYLDMQPNNIWRPLFYPNSWLPIRFDDIADLPYYNLHFIYAYTCDPDLAKIPKIAAQNDPSFCDQHPLRPACVTHQMMGLLLLKRSQCGNQVVLGENIKALQQRIHTQLTWDPRVVDVYMQRVLMLVESGASDAVKPVWLQALIAAQQKDGGWSPFMPLIPVGGDRSIGVDRLPGIRSPRSSFHTTAQGVLLFALLTQSQQ